MYTLPLANASAPRWLCTVGSAPGASTVLRNRIEPSRRSSAISSWWFGCSMPTTYTRLLAGSATGVLVMPTGSTSPHGSELAATGRPRPTCCHFAAPVALSNAYTESWSVATITVLPTTSGSPYTLPSMAGDVHARCNPFADGPSFVTFERVGSPPHIVHVPLPGAADDELDELDDARVDVVVVAACFAPPLHAQSASNDSAANWTRRRRTWDIASACRVAARVGNAPFGYVRTHGSVRGHRRGARGRRDRGVGDVAWWPSRGGGGPRPRAGEAGQVRRPVARRPRRCGRRGPAADRGRSLTRLSRRRTAPPCRPRNVGPCASRSGRARCGRGPRSSTSPGTATTAAGTACTSPTTSCRTIPPVTHRSTDRRSSAGRSSPRWRRRRLVCGSARSCAATRTVTPRCSPTSPPPSTT